MADTSKMLVDGTNPEGVDPSPPLVWASKDDIKDVFVYGGTVNPPVTKIRAHLAYHSIQYKCVQRKTNSQPEGCYQKIPSISVNGRQVNDSYVILKFLVPVLYGSLSDEQLAWEEHITYSVMIAMEIEAFEDGDSCGALLSMGGYPSFLAYVAFPFLPFGGQGKKMPAGWRAARATPKRVEKYGELKTCNAYLVEFKNAVGEKAFFSGDQPGAVDVSMFATFKAFGTLPYTGRALQSAGLTDWYDRVKAKMPSSFENDAFEKARA